jgi:WD repeat-containing protein 22
MSGSDDFNLYMWKIPDEPPEKCKTRFTAFDLLWIFFFLLARCFKEAHLVLKGHRSVVNQVRSNPSNQLIISSGVEKIIKVISLSNQSALICRIGFVLQSNNFSFIGVICIMI